MLSMSLDFETFSEIDIKRCGAHVYAAHPSTEPLCLAWAVDDQEPQLWLPGQPIPPDLRAAIEHPEAWVFRAHNAQFERLIWREVMVKRYGWPEIPLERWRCNMAACAYRALPLGLDDAGDALGLTIQKDKRGKDLIRKLCQPRKPTKADPSTRCRDPQLLQELYAYCLQDVRAEQALHAVVGDLPPAELEVWQVDQIINDAGVQLDTALIANAMLVSAELSARYDAEMARITGGAVASCTQTKALAEWGDFYRGVSKEAIEHRLAYEKNPVRRAALELRQLAGRSSIAKLERLIDWCGDDNRVRGMLQYHGATTGRWAGRGPQPQNMPRPKPGYAMPDLLAQCSAAELGLLTDDVLEVVASSLRGAYIPAAGCELGWADFSAIEARVVLWLAEQDDALEIFKRGDCIYCEMATSIYGYPVKKGMPERQDGKTIILGCFGADTEVLTDNGYKPITDVTLADRLWDGVEWVPHAGVAYMGDRECVSLAGVSVTADHRVWSGSRWETAGFLASNGPSLSRSLAHATASLPSPDTLSASGAGVSQWWLSAPAAARAWWRSITSAVARQPAAMRVPSSARHTPVSSTEGSPQSARMITPERDCSRASPPRSPVATIPPTPTFPVMVGGASACTSLGELTGPRSSRIWSRCRDTMTRAWSWIEQTLIGGMSRGTCASSPGGPTSTIAAPSVSCKRRLPVYDMLLSGPRSRFTVRTAGGHLIVHNCGFGMGAAKFQDTANKGLRADGRPEISLETAQERVTGYRERFAMVPRLWRGLEDAARKAIQNPNTVCRYGKIAYCFNPEDNFLRCRLPSGRYLHYYAPRLEQPDEDWKRPEIRYWAVKQVDGGAKVWTEVRSYGGLLTENVVQAIARDLMVAAILRIRRKFGPSGLHIILTVHDEVIYEYPIGAIDPKAIEATMAETPEWAPGCPVAAEASRGSRYGK